SLRKIRVLHFLRGELPFPSIRRFRCPTWRCFVALRADRRLQFSSRPPSPEPFFGWIPKVYSGRREADVPMSSATSDFSHQRFQPPAISATSDFTNCSPNSWQRLL